MTTPSFVSGAFARNLLDPTRPQTNRRRHPWRWPLLYLLLGICVGWVARGIFI